MCIFMHFFAIDTFFTMFKTLCTIYKLDMSGVIAHEAMAVRCWSLGFMVYGLNSLFDIYIFEQIICLVTWQFTFI